MKLFTKIQKKETSKLPMTGKVKKGFRYYCMAVLSGFRRKRSAYRCE